jgi:hypothetical protein
LKILRCLAWRVVKEKRSKKTLVSKLEEVVLGAHLELAAFIDMPVCVCVCVSVSDRLEEQKQVTWLVEALLAKSQDLVSDLS